MISNQENGKAETIQPAGNDKRVSALRQGSLAAVSALLLYGLLVDAAVETFWSVSPVRWWVVGVVGVYVLATAVLWRRLSWNAKATASLATVLGLFAISAWLPESTTSRLLALGQSNSTLLSAITAMAIVLAALTLLRIGRMPLIVKGAIALLALYGTAAFVAGSVAGTSYPQLLHGESVLRRLPIWLRGSLIGAAVVLPLGFIAQLIAVVRRDAGPWGWRQTIASGLTLVMVGSGLTTARPPSPSISAQAQSSSPSAVNQWPSAAERQQFANQVEPVFRAMGEFGAAVQTDTFHPQAILDKTARDPHAIFRWVRDETLWVPYRGVLRGAAGVLMDRKGNDLDRALLLTQLLSLAGQEVRLAHATLSKTQAAEILRIPRPRPIAESAPASGFSREVSTLESSKDRTSEASRLRSFADELIQKQIRMARDAGERSVVQANAIAAAVALPTSKRGSAQRHEDLDGVQDHWWVQWHRGSDWIDLDPSMPQSEPGRPLATAQETVAPGELDSSLYHEVEVRVIIERWEQGKLQQTQVLTHVLRAAELNGIEVSLLHLPIALPQELSFFGGADSAEQLKEVALGQHEWLPALKVGPAINYQFSFTDTGIKRTGRPGAMGFLARKVETAFGGLGSAGGQNKRTALTGEWIEYEIRSPGQPARKIRRQLFDLVGPSLRVASTVREPRISAHQQREVAMTLMGTADILILHSQPSRDFVAHLFAKAFLANRQPLLNLISAEPENASAAAETAMTQFTRLPTPLYGLALARSEWSRHRNDVYIDRPLVLSTHKHIRQGPDGNLLESYSYDIVANDVTVRADSDLDPSMVRLEQGVLDTNAEALLASAIGHGTAQHGRAIISNVGEIYRQAGTQGVEWSVIRGIDDPAWRRMEVGADARARISEDLAAGYVIMAPNRPVVLNGQPAFGWWRVDPDSGQSLGVNDQGWGTAMVEYAVILIHTTLCLYTAGHTTLPGNPVGAMTGMILCAIFGGMAAIGVGVGAVGLLLAMALLQGSFELAMIGNHLLHYLLGGH